MVTQITPENGIEIIISYIFYHITHPGPVEPLNKGNLFVVKVTLIMRAIGMVI